MLLRKEQAAYIKEGSTLAGLDHSGADERAGQVRRDDQLVQVAGVASKGQKGVGRRLVCGVQEEMRCMCVGIVPSSLQDAFCAAVVAVEPVVHPWPVLGILKHQNLKVDVFALPVSGRSGSLCFLNGIAAGVNFDVREIDETSSTTRIPVWYFSLVKLRNNQVLGSVGHDQMVRVLDNLTVGNFCNKRCDHSENDCSDHF